MNIGYRPLVASTKPHARIIWDVSFSPLFPAASGADDMLFATGSRDKTVKIWRRPSIEDATVWAPAATLKFDEGVTSLDFYSGILGVRSVFSAPIVSARLPSLTRPLSVPDLSSPSGSRAATSTSSPRPSRTRRSGRRPSCSIRCESHGSTLGFEIGSRSADTRVSVCPSKRRASRGCHTARLPPGQYFDRRPPTGKRQR